MSLPQPTSVVVFDNLNVACLDERGNQISALNDCLLFLWADRATALGYSVENVKFETVNGHWRLIKTENGWRREVVYG